ncbi:MAG: hypothetical protein SOY06_04070 [Prevotella sp.]|nr:hypothetical protein [Bacteroidales bacterium]MDY4229005.1 hypothetical protein [Prevotella sp.]
MRKTYIAPKAETITAETEQFIATSPSVRITGGHYMQYDGWEVHDEVKDYGVIVGPASEYVGTVNEDLQVNEDDIFDD